MGTRLRNQASLGGLLVGAALCALVEPAHSAKAMRLDYSRTLAANACPDEHALREAVEQRLGYAPFVADATDAVVVEFRESAAGLVGRVYMVANGIAAGGTREIFSRSLDCKELFPAIALAITIAIDPSAVERTPAPSGAPETSSPEGSDATTSPGDATAEEPVEQPSGTLAPLPPRGDTPRSPPSSTRAAAAAQRPVWMLGGGAFVASGPVPGPAFGGALFAGVRGEHWALSIEPRATLPSTSGPQGGVVGDVRMTSYGSSVAPCYRSDAFLGCYVLDLGVTTAEGRGVDVSRADSSFWAAQGLRAAYRWASAGGLGIAARADALWAMTHTVLTLDGKSAFETPRLFLRFGLDANYEF